MRYYIDVCIWRDYFENHSDNFRPLGEWALRLIKKVIEEESFVLYSNLVEKELRKEYSDEKITDIFSIVPSNLLIKVKISAIQFNKAKILSRQLTAPLADTIHAVAARENAVIMITRDKHFIELNEITDIKKPEDLI